MKHTSDTAKKLGQKIRSLRLELGISQEELAFKAGISAAHLGQIERAVKKPTIDTIDKIALALDTALPVLFEASTTGSLQDTSATMNKIVAQLSSMSEEQQKDILKIIKIYRHSKP